MVCVDFGWAGVDSAWEQKNLKAKSLFKYDLCTLNAFPDFNVAFGWGHRTRSVASGRVSEGRVGPLHALLGGFLGYRPPFDY